MFLVILQWDTHLCHQHPLFFLKKGKDGPGGRGGILFIPWTDCLVGHVKIMKHPQN